MKKKLLALILAMLMLFPMIFACAETKGKLIENKLLPDLLADLLALEK